MAEHLKIGKIGEDLAASDLKKRGFKIIGCNYWKPFGEIDIVASQKGIIHFVEVKTAKIDNARRETGDYFDPLEDIHHDKRRRLSRAIQTYLLEKEISQDVEWQIDAARVLLDLNGNLRTIDWLEDIIL